MNQAEREAWLEGYRFGLGDAIRSVDKTSSLLPTYSKLPIDPNELVRAVLDGLAIGLRLISASSVLSDRDAINDE